MTVGGLSALETQSEEERQGGEAVAPRVHPGEMQVWGLWACQRLGQGVSSAFLLRLHLQNWVCRSSRGVATNI